MSSNIYEDPDLTMNIKYGKEEDRRDRLEKVVDIYETLGMFTEQQVDLSAQDREPHAQKRLPAVQRNWIRALAQILLCLLLVAGLTVLCTLYMTSVSKVKELNNEKKILTSEHDRINCQPGKENQRQGNATGWKRFQCICYYISTEKKNWTESREDCKKSKADLVVLKNKNKNDYFKELCKNGEFWIGLESKSLSKDWSEQHEWKWVDGSLPTYRAWKANKNTKPGGNLKVYMDTQGTWIPTNSGSRHWICERDIY